MNRYLIKNIKGAKAQGIKVGVYIFSQAITEKEARAGSRLKQLSLLAGTAD